MLPPPRELPAPRDSPRSGRSEYKVRRQKMAQLVQDHSVKVVLLLVALYLGFGVVVIVAFALGAVSDAMLRVLRPRGKS